jgi:hypothetical protein
VCQIACFAPSRNGSHPLARRWRSRSRSLVTRYLYLTDGGKRDRTLR